MTIPPNTMHSDIGRRTLPAEIDRQAKLRPDKIVHSIPISSNLADGYRDVTILEFAKAIDRACEYLEPLIGTSNTLDTVAYYGPPDLRYLILIIAVNKLGFKLLASAPRNSLPMHLHLLNITDCRIILHARQIDVSAMVGTHEAARHPVPDLAELLWSDKEPRHYPYTKTFDEVKNDPYFVLHTSGSTGMPKPILHRHSWAAIQDIFTHMPPVNGMPTRSSMLGRHARIGTWFPPWHVGGSIMLGLAPTIFGEKIDVWPPADRMPSGKANMEMVEYGRCQEIVNGPSVYAEIVNDPELYEKLGMLERVWYGGGVVDARVGNAIIRKTGLTNCFGSTETGVTGFQLMNHSEEWQYIPFMPTPGMEMREISPGQYEMVFVRRPEDEHLHCIWTTFPELNEYHQNDIFSKHPTKENLWFYEGRMDDLIIFAAGTKHQPLAYEEQLRSNPLVKAALVVGTGHHQAAVLIELAEPVPDTEEAREKIKEELWPTIEAANKVAPKHAIVKRTHVMLAKSNRPFLRASKGTVQRGPTLREYKQEIDELYQRAGDEKPEGTLAKTMDEHSLKMVGDVNGEDMESGAKLKRRYTITDEETLKERLRKLELEKERLELQIHETLQKIDSKRSGRANGVCAAVAVH